MWDCVFCGCRMIAGSLTFCPVCRKDKSMPKITTDGGPSNAAAAEGEPGYVAPEPAQNDSPEPAQSPLTLVGESGPEPAPVIAEGGITLPPAGAGNG